MSLGQIYLMTCHNYFYVGKHTGDIFKDKYFGSGVVWRNVINKYGTDCVHREILATYDSEEEGNLLEKRYISEYKTLYQKRCLNIADGGQGGNLGIEVNKRISVAVSGDKNGMYGKTLNKESRLKISKALKDKEHKPNIGKTFDKDWRHNLSTSHIGKNVGKFHTPEEIEKIKIARKNQKNLKLDNWRGYHWYTNGVDSHMYKDGEQPNNWYRGRTIKR